MSVNHAISLHNRGLSLYPDLCFNVTIGFFRSNLVEGIDASYINKCLYDPDAAPLCPIFKLGDIVKLSGFNFETIAKVVSKTCIALCGWTGKCLCTLFLLFCPFCLALLLWGLVSCMYCVLTGRSHWYCS